MIYLIGIAIRLIYLIDLPSLSFLPYLIFAEISSTSNSPRFNLSVIIFLIPQLPSSSAKISFINTLLISETTFHFTAKISIALCWPISRDTKSLFSSLISGVKPSRLSSRKNFSARIFPQPQKCGARLITLANQPVQKPSTTSIACSQANHLFFSTIWKYWRLPTWLKTLKYRYWKCLDVVRTRKIGMSLRQEIKTFSA